MPSLSELLKTGVSDAIKKQIVADLKKKSEDAEQAAKEAKEAFELVARELGLLEAVPNVVRGLLYFFPSRSSDSGAGHFIENTGTSIKCSCKAGQFGRRCWAQKYVLHRYWNAHDYRYMNGVDQFDARAKPYRYGLASRAPSDSYSVS